MRKARVKEINKKKLLIKNPQFKKIVKYMKNLPIFKKKKKNQ